ncbi:MAG: hypothetical protein KIT16_24230 [Rhodospirillaceae bacterium]|nr:hypothetical protein [Rhodospirillaceae bacterium]
MYRRLDPAAIADTLGTLERRIAERFPERGLRKVCAELTTLARLSGDRIRRISAPQYGLRLATGAVIAFGLALLVYVSLLLDVKREGTNVYGILQGFESGFNIVVLVGAAIFFIARSETRWKRKQAMEALHELRSVVHVIDMHQLTKDPNTFGPDAAPTASSPQRDLGPYALGRYLDYCSEMLSLAAKVAALYAQSSKDPVVIDAASDIGATTINLSNKIWQKITILHQTMPAAGAAAPAQAPAAVPPAPNAAAAAATATPPP